MRDIDVLILGCGPAGLVAAEAAKEQGLRVAIAAKKRQSELFGCQYLHAPIPGIHHQEPTVVRYQLKGTIEGYREKVYGPQWQGDTSPISFLGDHPAWDIRHAYEVLWSRWADFIVDGILTAEEVPDMLRYFGDPTMVFSTIPAPVLCVNRKEHTFEAETVWAIGDAPERGVRCPVRTMPDTVICNGEESPSWYRVSMVFGHTTCEWPKNKKPPYENVAEVNKPLRTNCDCHPEIYRLGRYGAWRKGYLVHQAREDTLKVLCQTGVQGRMF